jgi:hypothetical protein
MISLYYVLKYFIKDYHKKDFRPKQMLLHGALFSCVLLIKYNTAIFWALPMIAIFISLLINKQFKDALKCVIMFIAGCGIIIVPWLIYFIANGALYDFIETYFLFNAKYYTNQNTNITGVVSLILAVFKNGIYLFKQFPLEYGFASIGLLFFIFYPSKIKWWQRLITAASLGVVFAAIFFNSTGHIYYSMGVTVFLIFSIMAVCRLIVATQIPVKSYAVAIIAIIMLCITIYRNPYHTDSRLFSKENNSSAVQIEFAKLMNETDDPTLLNYGFLDGGFFTIADIVPNVRWFQRQNKIFETYPEHKQEHERYIREKVTDYIVRRIKKDYYEGELKEVPYLDENYELISQQQQHFEGFDFIYFLYRVKD